VDHDDRSPSAASWQWAMVSMAALGVPPPLPWSRGAWPVPEEDMSAVTVLVGGGPWHAVLRRDRRGRVGGGSRDGRSRGGCGHAPAAVVESRGQAGP
jgi:hypothetical protein